MEPVAKKPAKHSPKDQNANALLQADHQLASGLFAAYEDSRSSAEKERIAAQICIDLAVYAQVEEEIFYPMIIRALQNNALVPNAMLEHATLKALFARVNGAEPNAEMFDASFGDGRVRGAPRQDQA